MSTFLSNSTNLTEIIKSAESNESNLPAKMDDLSSFIIIGQGQLEAVKAGIKAMKKIDFAKEVFEQKLEEAQNMADLLIDAQCKLGELTKKLLTYQGKKHEESKKNMIKKLGFNLADISRFERISENKDIIENEKKKSREKSDVLSLSQILKAIQKENRLKNNNIKIENDSKFDLPTSIKLYLGDATNLDFIDDESIDLLCTDPPYFVIDEKWDKFESLDKYLEWLDFWLGVVSKKIKSTGRMYISFANYYKYDIYNLFKKNNFYGFNFGNEIIWNYKNTTKPFDRKKYRINYDPIFYFYGKDASELNFTEYNESLNSVWEISTPQSNYAESKLHPCQKPLELYRRIVKTGSNSGDVVLDTFAGSGTTGIICENLNRSCIMIEDNEEYHKIIRGRINSFQT